MIPNEAPYGNSGSKRGLLTLLDSLLIPIIIVLVGVAAFGLGRLSASSGEAALPASSGSAVHTN